MILDKEDRKFLGQAVVLVVGLIVVLVALSFGVGLAIRVFEIATGI